ncbi:MAG: tRNA preQ1(34) S-adenosylmethionine ribosyltransferase-isomerase QueA [Cyanobium sp. M30B3]|nr:MAG: tRNA preQ1(34) S-adenosylmethionine ribosyltransferase-isomerase QueA [Cyanobium sp. M30B3]
MSTPADLRLSSYDFPLPQERIAQRPVEPRHAARLLAVDPLGSGPAPHVRHLSVWDLQQELRPGDLLVVNDTRVLRARLEARRPTGGAVELLVLEPWQPPNATTDPAGTAAGVGAGVGRWLCLAKPAKKLQAGHWIEVVAAGQPPLPVQVLGRDPATGGRILQFPADCADAASLEPLLVRYGAIPLPPYIHEHDAADNERYQTRYATRPGAVAAPTAGLHLSDALLEAIRARGVELATTTLHVGLGTFRPVETEDLRQLELHSEWVEVTPQLVEAVAACRARGGRVIAIGTTSVRSLEAVAQLHGGVLAPHTGPVNLVIQPGYRFAVVQGLLTNFHLPRSSLLLLVSALIGRERLLALYAEAIERQYRFFSYGDAMWIAPEAVLNAARPAAGRHTSAPPDQRSAG